MVDKLFIALKEFNFEKDEDGNVTSVNVIDYDANQPIENWYKDDPETARKARNNAIVDFASAVLAHPSTSAKINHPGNFDKLGDEAERSLLYRKNKDKWAIEKGIITQEDYDTWKQAHSEWEKSKDGKEPMLYTPEQRRLLNNSILNASISSIKKFNDGLSEGINPLSTETFAYYHNQNMAGGKLIGIYANNTTAQAKYQLSKLRVGKKYEFVINGHTVSSLHEAKRKKSDGTFVYISQNCAEFSAASVDNVKDPKLAKMIQHPDNAFITGTMLRMGLTIDEIALVFSIFRDANRVPKSVEELAKIYPISTYNAFTKDLKNPKNIAVTSDMIGSVVLSYETISSHLTQTTSLQDLVSQGLISQQEADNYNAVGEVLYKILKVAPEIKELTSLSRADSPKGGVKSTLPEAIKQVLDLIDFHAKQQSQHILEGVEGVVQANFFRVNSYEYNSELEEVETVSLDNKSIDAWRTHLFDGKSDMPMLQAHFSLGIQGAITTPSRFFKQLNTVFMAKLNELRRMTGVNHLPKGTILRFMREATVYALSQSSMFSRDIEEQRMDFLYRYPQRFYNLKRENAKVLSKYGVISKIQTRNGDLAIPELPRLLGIKEQFQRELISMLSDETPLKNGQTVRDVVLDLFRYSYFRDGLGYRYGGFSGMFGTAFLQYLTDYMSYMRELEFNGSDGVNLDNFMDQFIRNANVANKLFLGVNLVKTTAEGYYVANKSQVHNYKDGTNAFNYVVVRDPKSHELVGLYEKVTNIGDLNIEGLDAQKQVVYKEISVLRSSSPVYNGNMSADDLIKTVETNTGLLNQELQMEYDTTHNPDAYYEEAAAKMDEEYELDYDPDEQIGIEMEDGSVRMITKKEFMDKYAPDLKSQLNSEEEDAIDVSKTSMLNRAKELSANGLNNKNIIKCK